MSERFIHQFEMNPEGLLQRCAQFGLALIKAETSPQAVQACWLRGQAQEQSPAEAYALFQFGEQAPSDAMLSFALPAGDWLLGLACLDRDSERDLIYTPQGPFDLARWFEPDPQWNELQSLLSQVRDLLGERDWWVYWIQNPGTQAVSLAAIYPRGWDWQPGQWQLLDFAPLPEQASSFSLSMLTDAWLEYRDLQIPVDDSQVLSSDLQVLAGRCYLKSLDFTNLGWPEASLRVSGLGKRVHSGLDAIWHTFLIKPVSLQGHLQQWQEILRIYLPLAQECTAWWQYLAAYLQRKQRLFDLCADQLSAPAQMHNELNVLWNLAHDWRLDYPDEEPSEIFEDDHFKHSWKHFMGQYGHWADGALDLAQPRLQDQSSALLESLFGNWSLEHEFLLLSNVKGKRSAHWNLLLWVQKQHDKLQNDALWALTQVRQYLLEFASQWVDKGLLRKPEDIWALSAQDWLLLEISDATKSMHPLHQQLTELQGKSLNWSKRWRQQVPFDQVSLRGQGLQMGFISGQISHYQSGQINLAPELDANRIILVCQHVDMAMLPLIEQVAAVIVSQGSACHPAIRILLELGKIGLFALSEAAGLPEGQWVRLNTDTGALSLIEAESA